MFTILEKANTLLQDFNTLSDELRVVEEELKDSIQVNEMDNTNFHPLAESQPSGNNIYECESSYSL